MNRLLHFLLIGLTVSSAFAAPGPVPGPAPGPASRRQREGIAAGLDDLLISNPSNVVGNATQITTGGTPKELETTAGAATAPPAESAVPGPEVFLEFEWNHIQDFSPQGPDGDRFGPLIGADWSLGDGVTVGGMFGYGHERRATSSYSVTSRSNDYTVALYGGKNFGEWINVGATVVFDYQSRILKSYGLRLDGYNYTIGVSPFVGVAHTWDKFSFASTATYIYQYNDVNLDANSNSTIWTEAFGSHGYLHVNEASYAVTDKLTLSVLANINVEIHQEDSVYSSIINLSDGFFMTWGARAEYQYSERVRGYCQFQADTFNRNFEVYSTIAGISLSF